jgi:hypothetical protein
VQRRVAVLEGKVRVDTSCQQEVDHAKTPVLDRETKRASKMACSELDVCDVERHLRKRINVVA